MRKLGVISFIIFSQILFGQLVINEIVYDPEGSDSGKEWLELYNYTEINVNLLNWKIEKAGTEFEEVLTFQDTIILEPYSYFLIAEEMIQHADYFADLGFQNGGSATDGVRIISPTKYTDTFLYDSPNENQLLNDNNEVATEFCDDISFGSYARKLNGVDTNSCNDWYHCVNPTSGAANLPPVDIAITEFSIVYEDGCPQLLGVIHNLSTFFVDNVNSFYTIKINEEKVSQIEIPELYVDDYYTFIYSLEDVVTYSEIKVLLYNEYDINEENNVAQLAFQNGEIPFLLNEVMIQPSSDECEWIELYSSLSTNLSTITVNIVDSSDRSINFAAKTNIEYQIVCENKEQFLTCHNIDPELVIEANSWTTLNNGSESLILKDDFANIFDSLQYSFSSLDRGVSYERKHPSLDIWDFSRTICTPASTNSIFPAIYDLYLENSWAKFQENKVFHYLTLKNNGLNNIDEFELKIEMISKDGTISYEEYFAIDDSLFIEFSTPFTDNGFWTILYEVYHEKDEISKNNYSSTTCIINDLPLVVNEVMFAPNIDEPEWIEICNNCENYNFSFFLKNDDVKKEYILPAKKYFLITGNEEDSLFLSKINPNTPILLGLGSLSNSGESIGVYVDSSLVEEFSYNPDWADRKGYSAERINSKILSNNDNWMQSPVGSTPGKRNSVAVEELPNKTKIQIEPNPFSPYINQICTIKLTIPERVSRARMLIYDLKGRKVRTLKKIDFVASDCTLLFDGKSDNGKKLLPGIYFFYLEAIGNSGKSYKEKESIVIGYK